MKWAAEQFQEYLLDSPSTQAEMARKYLGERKLSGESVRKFGLGFAPPEWEWLTTRAANAGKSADLLETVGLIGRRKEGKGYYDRFRDRVMFPIRDLQGRIIAFGGRILPSSPVSADQPAAKYINSAETPLFSKSDQLYGLDLAKHAADKAGYLAVVEGYTDVMMAHQHGISQVVATMGTALNERHVRAVKKQLIPRVVLVYDADAGGEAGVDRAMKVFVLNDIDLRIATLPDGLDPCDLLISRGPGPFQDALEKAVEVFEIKIQRVAAKTAQYGMEGHRQAAEELLAFVALTPHPAQNMPESAKVGLLVNRIAHRFHIREDLLWARLKDLRRTRKDAGERDSARSGEGEEYAAPPSDEPRAAKAMPHERELVEVLLADPPLVARAIVEIPPDEVEHPGLRKVIEALYRLLAHGQTADLDHLQGNLDERLWNRLHDLQEAGFEYPDPAAVYLNVLTRFRERKETRKKLALKNQLQTADPASSLELLKKLRDQK